MNKPVQCADIELLLPELALGTISGEDRARTLEHLGGCRRCRRELQELNELGDEFLLLAPSTEPPVGFESRVMDRLGAGSRAVWPRSRRGVAIAAAAALLMFLGATATYLAVKGDRELADGYREALEVANGEYVAARALTDERGGQAGHIFGYQGSPSWIFCVVSSGRSDTTYDIEVSSEDGRTWELGEIYVHQSEATWGRALPIDLHDVAEIRLVARSGDETLVARWVRR